MGQGSGGVKAPASLILIPVKSYIRNGKPVALHTRLVKRALRFARERHHGQTRADGVTPYIVHPESVVEILRRHGVSDPHVLAAAALHDVVEDTPTPIGEIRERFGEGVADIVGPLTDPPGLKGEERRKVQLERILRSAPGVQQIKLADKISNMQDAVSNRPPDWTDEAFDRFVRHAEVMGEALLRVHPELCHELLALVHKARSGRAPS